MMLSFWICLVLPIAYADLRKASQPKRDWKVQQRNHKVPFQAKFALYMEPSDFMYQGLKQQRDGGAYDNFLRSNIDNEQDRRNFNTEAGKDHLPFRTYETAANDVGQATQVTKMVPASKAETGVTAAGNCIYADPGVPNIAPLRWNNPHSSELEMNIWVMKKAGGPHVIPVMKPSCSGEGYQDNVYRWTVPADFNTKASCQAVGDCVLQVYAHSVESRMYSSGTPIIVNGGTGAWDSGNIKEAQKDKAFALKDLRRLCLPTSDPTDEASYKTTNIFKARLSSDVYNHAYQNSDFSPYAGQQPHFISQNLQASCILKMTANNFGELGKKYMQKTANEARDYANKLDKKARGLIRNYETTTNAIINAIKYTFYNTHEFGALEIPQTSVMCTEWRDQWDRRAGGRLRGNDRTGGYCAQGETCYCHGDCYLGYGAGDALPDAVCVKMEDKKDEAGAVVEGMKVVVEGSETARGLIQKTETCFRCAEVGSTKVNRQNTNTYIPSFEIAGVANCNTALAYIAPMYLKSGFLTNPLTGKITKKNDDRCILQIYMAVLTEMWPEFKMATTAAYMETKYANKYNRIVKDAEKKLGENATPEQVAAEVAAQLKKYAFNYRGPMMKTTTATMSDANGGIDHQFKKLNDAGDQDGGYYSAKKAWPLHFAAESETSHDVPQTDGPLSSTLQPSTNVALTKRSEQAEGLEATPVSPAVGSNVVFSMPPDPAEEPAAGCVIELSGFDMDGTEISAEQVDMDGLNYDADCDNDAAIAELQTKHLAACAEIQEGDPDNGVPANVAYVCPEFEEPVCHVQGQSGKLPGQMFTNEDGVVVIINNAKAVVPSAVIGLALTIVAAML